MGYALGSGGGDAGPRKEGCAGQAALQQAALARPPLLRPFYRAPFRPTNSDRMWAMARHGRGRRGAAATLVVYQRATDGLAARACARQPHVARDAPSSACLQANWRQAGHPALETGLDTGLQCLRRSARRASRLINGPARSRRRSGPRVALGGGAKGAAAGRRRCMHASAPCASVLICATQYPQPAVIPFRLRMLRAHTSLGGGAAQASERTSGQGGESKGRGIGQRQGGGCVWGALVLFCRGGAETGGGVGWGASRGEQERRELEGEEEKGEKKGA